MKSLRLPKTFVLAASTLTVAVLCLGAGVNAQKDKDGDHDPQNWDPIKKGIHPSGDLYPVKYFTDDKGRLWMSPSPSSGETDGKELVFPERMREWRHVTSHLGLLGFIRLAFCGNQDLLSLTDAEYHFRKMKLPRTDVELRQRLVMEPVGKTPALQRRAEMDRLLAVRLLQQRGVKGAKFELEKLASDAAAGSFVRVAAREALANLLPEKFQAPARSKVDQKPLLAMPAGCQVIGTIDQTLVPRWSGLVGFARMCGLTVTLQDVRAAGGTASPAIWAGATKLADVICIAPYEMCRRLGNARVFRTTVALRFMDDRPVPFFWLRWDGIIPADQLKAAMEGDGYEVEAKNAAFHVDLGDAMVMSFSGEQLTLRSSEFPMEGAGKDAEKLLAAGFGKPALWVHLPDGKALLDRFKGTPAAAALPKITRATVNVSFAKDANINARIDVPVGREATGVFRQIEVGLEMAATAAEQAEKRMAAGVGLMRKESILMGRILKNVELDETDDGKAVLVTWKPGDLTFDAILKILDGG